jgi:nitrogen fixation protein FixH
MSARASKPFELRGVHVLAGLLAFFGAIIAVNIVFAVAAVQTFPGEDVRRSYLQGLRYNETLAERQAQSSLGWRAAAGIEAAEHGARLQVALRTRDGAPIDGAGLAGVLMWPTDSRLDRALSFVQDGAGHYVADLGDLPDGRWRLRARAETAGGALDFESELTWRASR